MLNDPAIIVPRTLYERATPVAQQGDFLIYVKAKPGADMSRLRSTLVDTVKPYIVVSVQDGSEFTSDQASQINTLLLLIYALLALAVIIAVLGIVNTLALSVFERTREIGLLRAVGLTRGQLSRTITIEAVATALFGAVLGTSWAWDSASPSSAACATRAWRLWPSPGERSSPCSSSPRSPGWSRPSCRRSGPSGSTSSRPSPRSDDRPLPRVIMHFAAICNCDDYVPAPEGA